MNTLKNNKLIAEFMGLVVSNREDYHSSLHTNVDADLLYHTSWDWLMPVVERIEEIALEEVEGVYKVHRFCVNFNFTQAEITDMSTGMIVGYGDTGMKLESTYEAVVEFINWYNTQNQEA